VTLIDSADLHPIHEADMERLSKGIYLAQLLFSVSAIFRLTANAAITLENLEPETPADLKIVVDEFCYSFASHDGLLSGLRMGSFGHRPNGSRFFEMIESKLERYEEVRNKFLTECGETEAGDTMVRVNYAEFSEWLLPLHYVLADIQEALGLAQVLNRLPSRQSNDESDA